MATGVQDIDLQDMICCQICCEDFKHRDPRCLTCLHAFCSICIQQMLEVASKTNALSGYVIHCPVCKAPTEIPGGSVTNLPAFFYYNQIQSALKRLEENSLLCRLCLKREVSNYCFQCKIATCLDCTGKHDTKHKNHPQMKVDTNIMRYIQCPKHNQHVEAFCMTCSKAVCCLCELEDHDKHGVYSFTFESAEINNDLIDILNEKEKSADEFLERIEEMKQKFSTGMENTRQQLKDHHQQMIEDMEKQFKSMSLELQQMQDKVYAELDRSRVLMENIKARIVDLRKSALYKIQPIQEVPMARITAVDELLSDIKNSIPETDIDINEPKIVAFVKSPNVSLGQIELLDLNSDQLKHRFCNISQLTDKQYSPTFTIKELPWKLLVMNKFTNNERCLGIFLCCDKDSISTSWSCTAEFDLTLLPQKPGKKPFIRRCKHTFRSHEDDWGFSNFILWNELLNNGYLKNDTILVSCTLKADSPQVV